MKPLISEPVSRFLKHSGVGGPIKAGLSKASLGGPPIQTAEPREPPSLGTAAGVGAVVPVDWDAGGVPVVVIVAAKATGGMGELLLGGVSDLNGENSSSKSKSMKQVAMEVQPVRVRQDQWRCREYVDGGAPDNSLTDGV